MPAVRSYVLAGGRSRRFGSDKARADLDGTPLILRVAEVLKTVGDVTAVADVPDKYSDLGLPTIADRRPGLGPLAGLEAALADRLDRDGPGWIVVASCDLAGLRAEWVRTVVGRIADGRAAVAFRHEFWEPFPGAHHTDLRPAVTALLDAGRASFQRLLSETGDRAIALPLPADWPAVPQVNTPEQLAAFRASRRPGSDHG